MAGPGEIPLPDAQAIVDTVRDALLVLDQDLQVVYANRSFYQIFHVSPNETQGRMLYDLGDGGWDIPQLRVLLQKILPEKGELLDFEVIHEFPKIGRKVMRLNARRIQALDGTVQTILLAIEDITLRRETEEALAVHRKELEEIRRRLEEANLILQRQSTIDSLTGIANRRLLDERLEREWREALRASVPVALLMVDVDDFKDFNDRYGHQEGDDCLKRVAGVLNAQAARPADLAARYGGEEFSLLLPGIDRRGVETLAERLRAAVESLDIPHAGSRTAPRLTVSVGGACLVPIRGSSSASLIAAADQALYAAKAAGRNRVVVA